MRQWRGLRHRRERHGFTLVELTVASAITAILLLATMSSLFMGLKAIPTSGDNPTNTILAGRIIDQVAGELETALLVVAQTPTSITFTVPPRGTDTAPERISYSWSGTPGAPLLRRYNNGTTVSVIDAVYQFSLTPSVATSTESYPGISVEDTAESLLIDYSGTSGPGNQNVNSGNWFGQYYTSSSWPTGVVGWRPTRILFQAKQSATTGTAYVQFQLPNVSMVPTSAALEQYTLLGSSLTTTYTWQSFSFSQLPRLAPSAGICLVLQGVSGSPHSAVVQDTLGAGVLNTSNGGTSWSYQSNRSLQSILYGKLTRSSTTQYATSNYLSAITISLRAGSNTNLAVQTTAQTLNHPELLSVYSELKFMSDPTRVDVNGDGVTDWVQHGGGTFNTASLANGTWQATGGVGLDSQPGDNFTRITMIDLRFRALTTGSYAGFAINANRSGSTCAPVLARITLMADGTQTLTVWRKLTDSITDVLLSVPALTTAATDLHLVIDPSVGSVAITINGTQYGSFAYNRYASADPSTSASLTSSGSAEFSYVRCREVQP